MKKEVSIYHEYDAIEMLEPITDEKISEWDSNSVDAFSNFGLSILKTLNKYQFLNKKNIEICITTTNWSNWKIKNLSKMIKMLRKGGFIYAISTKKEGEDTSFNLVLYALTKKGADALEANGVTVKQDSICEIPIEKEAISRILQKASINQWHINVIANYKDIIKEHKYYAFNAKKNKNSVPSMVTIKHFSVKNERRIQQNVSLFAFPAPRKEEDVAPFIIELLKLQNYLVMQQRYRPALIIAICENMAHASWLSWKANKYRQTRPFFLLYSLDITTISGSLLANLYSCATDEEGLVKANINLT